MTAFFLLRRLSTFTRAFFSRKLTAIQVYPIFFDYLLIINELFFKKMTKAFIGIVLEQTPGMIAKDSLNSIFEVWA